MRRTAALLSVLFIFLLFPATCSAEWEILEEKLHESAFGTKYYYETKMSYADVSSSKTPIVVFWAKTVFDGNKDPDHAKLLSIGCPPETAVVELKYRVDINNKKAALIYGVLYDAKGRVLSTEDAKNAEYKPVPAGTGAEVLWGMIRDLHEKGAISR